jgi:hypothetical protein
MGNDVAEFFLNNEKHEKTRKKFMGGGFETAKIRRHFP